MPYAMQAIVKAIASTYPNQICGSDIPNMKKTSGISKLMKMLWEPLIITGAVPYLKLKKNPKKITLDGFCLKAQPVLRYIMKYQSKYCRYL